MTPGGLFCDCRFPGSAATINNGLAARRFHLRFAHRHKVRRSPIGNGAVTSAVSGAPTRGTGPLRLALAGATRAGSAGVGGLSHGPIVRLRRIQVESIGTFRRDRRLDSAGWERDGRAHEARNLAADDRHHDPRGARRDRRLCHLEPLSARTIARASRTRSAAAMRLHTYRDESHSRHFDLVGTHHWSIDLVTVTASGILVAGFACAVVALWIH
jgi:hypothetical protein